MQKGGKGPRPRAKREVRRGRRHGRSGPRKRITVFLSAPLLKKVSRMLAAEGRSLEACLEDAIEGWLKRRQPASEGETSERFQA
ncbi:MAG: hypothetical protein U1B94_00325 [candidate division NC10 bacterium]|nr:hypothetical protein [candidate division NC10 bacterium]